MLLGVKKVICTCEREMRRTGGTFGDDRFPDKSTYYCSDCGKHVIVLSPNTKAQEEFRDELQEGLGSLRYQETSKEVR